MGELENTTQWTEFDHLVARMLFSGFDNIARGFANGNINDPVYAAVQLVEALKVLLDFELEDDEDEDTSPVYDLSDLNQEQAEEEAISTLNDLFEDVKRQIEEQKDNGTNRLVIRINADDLMGN